MLKSLAFTFCTPDGESGIAVQKPSGGVKSLSIGLGTDNRSRIGFETWGDNKVDNNARGDIKADNNVGDDTVNDTVKHLQTRTRVTTSYNTRTRSVQHPYKRRRCLDKVMRGGVLKHGKHGPLTKRLKNAIIFAPQKV